MLSITYVENAILQMSAAHVGKSTRSALLKTLRGSLEPQINGEAMTSKTKILKTFKDWPMQGFLQARMPEPKPTKNSSDKNINAGPAEARIVSKKISCRIQRDETKLRTFLNT